MDEKSAIEKARQVAEQENWPWLEPVSASLTEEKVGKFKLFTQRPMRKVWNVRTHVHNFGGNIRIKIDDETGEVIGKLFAAR